MQLLPFVTNLIGGYRNAASEESPFGMSWQEQTLEVGAIVVYASDTVIQRVVHIARRDLAAFATKKEYRVGGCVHIVALRTDEYITGVDVRFSQSLGAVTGLRIFTNKSSSSWFGGAVGSVYSTLRASRGSFFNAILGFCTTTHCTRLGAFCCPLSMIQTTSCTTCTGHNRERTLRCGAGLFDGDQREFEELSSDDDDNSDDVRAIIVRCGDHIERVWVLSSAEYDQFRPFHDRAPLGFGEQCIELASDETIQRVDVLSHEVVNAIRFVTNQRETPWFGRATHGSVKTFACRKRFVGFHGTMGDKYIGALGVVFASDFP